jgi:malate synthase
MVRPRGWHLSEKHVLVDGERMSGSLFDFGLYLFHNAKEALARGTGPYFYLPKLESHLEARLWNDVFVRAQERLGDARRHHQGDGAHRDHHRGLRDGRDPVRTPRPQRRPQLRPLGLHLQLHQAPPDPSGLRHARPRPGHHDPPLHALLLQAGHQDLPPRGAHAMGGMAAQIPIKNDPEANEAALAKVRADKSARPGRPRRHLGRPPRPGAHRHGDLRREMPRPNQLDVLREDVEVTAADLLDVPDGDITEAGLRVNIDVGIQYLEAWLGGNGCVPIYNLMEDAATAEISRTQVWQWIRHGATLADGRIVTADLVRSIMDEELAKLRDRLGAERFDGGHFGLAAELFDRMATAETVEEFLTLAAYEHLD